MLYKYVIMSVTTKTAIVEYEKTQLDMQIAEWEEEARECIVKCKDYIDIILKLQPHELIWDDIYHTILSHNKSRHMSIYDRIEIFPSQTAFTWFDRFKEWLTGTKECNIVIKCILNREYAINRRGTIYPPHTPIQKIQLKIANEMMQKIFSHYTALDYVPKSRIETKYNFRSKQQSSLIIIDFPL